MQLKGHPRENLQGSGTTPFCRGADGGRSEPDLTAHRKTLCWASVSGNMRINPCSIWGSHSERTAMLAGSSKQWRT
eukprot:1962504-Amphidinium_carterae.1